MILKKDFDSSNVPNISSQGITSRLQNTAAEFHKLTLEMANPPQGAKLRKTEDNIYSSTSEANVQWK